jgi:hypothetical protein
MSVANRVFSGANPFDVDPHHYDHLATPDPADPDWSETHFWSVWNAEAGVGLFIHVGTDTEDKSLWWAQVFAYLPGDLVVADRSWGRSLDRKGPTTGNFKARCTEPLRRWRLQFDGAGELVSRTEMATRLVGAGPAVPMSFDLELTATMPVWDLYKAVEIQGTDIGSVHHEQVLTGAGRLRVGGPAGGEWSLAGCAFRDHSYGSRDVGPFGGDHLLGVYFPASGRSLQALSFWDKDGKILFRTASIHQGDQIEVIPQMEMSGLELGTSKPTSLYDLTGNPRTFEMRLQTNAGPVTAKGEVLHVINISLIDKNTNVNGSVINIPGDHLLLAESQVKMTWPDGDVGYGFFERCYKKSLLLSVAR